MPLQIYIIIIIIQCIICIVEESWSMVIYDLEVMISGKIVDEVIGEPKDVVIIEQQEESRQSQF